MRSRASKQLMGELVYHLECLMITPAFHLSWSALKHEMSQLGQTGSNSHFAHCGIQSQKELRNAGKGAR